MASGTNLCRVCDCDLLDTDIAFAKSVGTHAYLRIHCSACGSVYVTDDKGDLVRSEVFTER